MNALERLVPAPRLFETDSVDLALPPAKAWELVRHGDLARSRVVHALFALRTLPTRLAGLQAEPLRLRIDELVSTVDEPGFQILFDDGKSEVAIGAIGQVWKADIPFVHARDAAAFAAFTEPGFVKVAWSLRVTPLGERDSRITFDLHVDATDADAWKHFHRYFTLIGPASRFIRRSLLGALARENGTPAAKENERSLPGDELLPDAGAQVSDAIDVAATPDQIWPWLVQMGCRRAGFYAIDALDNGGERSAREIHPELQDLRLGQRIPATPTGTDGFDVLRLEPNRALVLGGLFDPVAESQLAFDAPRPPCFWQTTWAFVLEPRGAMTTRIHARGRAAFSADESRHAKAMGAVHHLMEGAQLRHLAARVEGRLPKDDWRDVREGASGAAIMVAAFFTPFLRAERNHWGLEADVAARALPGDELVREPRWSWTHGIEIDAPAEAVWPWVAQIGADRGGFYSYQWLENIAGCDLRNAEAIHPEWQARAGGTLRLHPKMPPLAITQLAPGESIVAFAPADADARRAGKAWAEVSWLFLVEPLGDRRCRFISRYRCASSSDLGSRLTLGPTLLEPVGFAMDRRMLLGVKQRAEARAREKERARP